MNKDEKKRAGWIGLVIVVIAIIIYSDIIGKVHGKDLIEAASHKYSKYQGVWTVKQKTALRYPRDRNTWRLKNTTDTLRSYNVVIEQGKTRLAFTTSPWRSSEWDEIVPLDKIKVSIDCHPWGWNDNGRYLRGPEIDEMLAIQRIP